MRFFTGIIVGLSLAVGIAYIHDSSIDGAGSEREARMLINWPVFNSQIRDLNETLAAGWNRLNEALPRKG